MYMPANTGTDTEADTGAGAATRSERLDALLAAHAADLLRIKALGESLEMNKLSSKFLSTERRRAIARLRHNAMERDKAIQAEQATQAPVAQIEGPSAAAE